MHRQSFGQYLNNVRLFVDELTEGEIDLDDLPDETDFGELYEDGVSAREAAQKVLANAGFFDFEF